MYHAASELASDPVFLEGFRSAARKIVWRTKHALRCMTHTLRVAEELLDEMDDSDF
jgi:hypothetical protein